MKIKALSYIDIPMIINDKRRIISLKLDMGWVRSIGENRKDSSYGPND